MSKPTTPELLNLLKTREFFSADAWTITFIGGAVLRFTSGDADITYNGYVYSAGGQTGPYFDRTDNKAKCHWAVGTSVDTLTVDVMPGTYTINGTPFLEAVTQGVFDGAEVILDRLYMPTYNDTRYGPIRYFVGRVAEFIAGRSIATMNINSHLEFLNLQFPRNIGQPTCLNNLGDHQCTVVLSSFETTGTLTGVPTSSAFTATLAAGAAAEAFDQGTITFTSGLLNGVSGTVQTCGLAGTAATIAMAGFLAGVPSAGDTFVITYGCNHSYTDANGCVKFSNQVHFRGFPFTPQPTVAV